MKTICVLSYQRTGSSWLCDILSGQQTICVQEIFSRDPLLFSYPFQQILETIYKVEPSIIATFSKIYNLSNFYINPENYVRIKNNILKKKPYSIELLYDIQKIVYQNNYNFVFKIFPEHLDNLNLQDILYISDYIIVNYRNSLIDSFVSEQKAIVSQKWTSLQKERPYLEKILWDEQVYKLYVDRVVGVMEYLIASINTKFVMFSYEQIHNSNDKYNYIKQNIQNVYPDFMWNFKQQSDFTKENYITNIYDNFLNPTDFLHSLSHIQKYLYE